MITIHVTRDQIVAAGLDPDIRIRMRWGRLVKVELLDGLRPGNVSQAWSEADDHFVGPCDAQLWQWGRPGGLLVSTAGA